MPEENATAQKTYRYYSTQRPVSIGTFPKKEKMVSFHNFDARTFCPSIGMAAWGYLDYSEFLDPEEAISYELAEDGNLPYWKVMCSVDDDGEVKACVTDVSRAPAKPFSCFERTKFRDIYTDWLTSEDEANRFATELNDESSGIHSDRIRRRTGRG